VAVANVWMLRMDEKTWLESTFPREHICGWRTPSGITMTPADCAACVEEKQARMNTEEGPSEG